MIRKCFNIESRHVIKKCFYIESRQVIKKCFYIQSRHVTKKFFYIQSRHVIKKCFNIESIKRRKRHVIKKCFDILKVSREEKDLPLLEARLFSRLSGWAIGRAASFGRLTTKKKEASQRKWRQQEFPKENVSELDADFQIRPPRVDTG